jgi:hypothetical protein
MPSFKVGDRVRWVRAAFSSEQHNALGTVVDVTPNDDANLEAFTIYDIEFEFGIFTLYGSQIEAE